MNMYDLIVKKKRGGELTDKEIQWMIREYTDENIPDYQMSAMMMAICFVGMTDEETKELTLAMAHSGDMLNLSEIDLLQSCKRQPGIGAGCDPCGLFQNLRSSRQFRKSAKSFLNTFLYAAVVQNFLYSEIIPV